MVERAQVALQSLGLSLPICKMKVTASIGNFGIGMCLSPAQCCVECGEQELIGSESARHLGVPGAVDGNLGIS